MPTICPPPGTPFYPNGTYGGWLCQVNNLTNSNTSDPVSGTVGITFHILPIIPVIFLGALYLFLWVKFADSPSRFKTVSITALVLIISIIMAATGFVADAVLNVLAFGAAFFLSFIFRF
jgi:hypothetical protein